MRALRILLLGTVGLILAFLIQFYVLGLLIGIALLPFSFLVIGQFLLPKSRRAIQVYLQPIGLEFEDEPEWLDTEAREQLDKALNAPARLSGRSIPPSYFKQWHEFQVEPHHFLLLLLVGLVSLGMALLVFVLKDALLNGVNLIFMALSLWSFACYLAWRWLWERRMLRRQGISLGSFYVSDGMRPGMKQVKYDFLDHDQERRGGAVDSLFVDHQDDLTLVFFNEANPDQSVPAAAMIFHKIAWSETNKSVSLS